MSRRCSSEVSKGCRKLLAIGSIRCIAWKFASPFVIHLSTELFESLSCSLTFKTICYLPSPQSVAHACSQKLGMLPFTKNTNVSIQNEIFQNITAWNLMLPMENWIAHDFYALSSKSGKSRSILSFKPSTHSVA